MKISSWKLAVVAMFLVVQFTPIFKSNSVVSYTEAFADESQEMVEHAPAILQAAYNLDWSKVISMAKKDKRQLNLKDEMGWTVLHQAASKGDDKVVTELLKLGADKNAKDTTIDQDRPYDIAKHNKKLSQKVINMLK